MYIKSIKLKNFRQFVNNEFEFDNESIANVIIAENSTGKTTFIQAFNYCFYGASEVNLKGIKNGDPSKLLSNNTFSKLKKDDLVHISVAINFSNNDVEYTLSRESQLIKTNSGVKVVKSDKVILKYIETDGSTKIAKDQSLIESIFPRSLSKYFLFDGERVENLGTASKSRNDEIATTFKSIAGIDVYDQLADIIKAKRRSISKQRKNINFNDSEQNELVNFIDTKEDFKLKTLSELNEINKQLQLLESDKKNYEDIISSNSESQKIYDNVKILEEEISDHTTNLEKDFQTFLLDVDYNDLVSIDLLCKARNNLENIIDKNDYNGLKLPNITSSVVDEILERKKCICNTNIDNNIKDILLELKSKLPPENINIMLSQTNNEIINKIEIIEKDFERAEITHTNFDSNMEKIVEKKKRIKLLMEKSANVVDVSETSVKLVECKDKISELTELKGKLKSELERTNTMLVSAQNKLDKIAKSDKELTKLNGYIKYLDCLLTDIKFISADLNERLVNSLSEGINSNWLYIFGEKDQKIELSNKDYSFKIVSTDPNLLGKEVEISSGQEVTVGCAFVLALITYAKNNEIYSKRFGSNFTLVLDAPVAKLDDKRRTRLISKIMEATDQIILLSADSQYYGAVEKVMSNYSVTKYKMLNEKDIIRVEVAQ